MIVGEEPDRQGRVLLLSVAASLEKLHQRLQRTGHDYPVPCVARASEFAERKRRPLLVAGLRPDEFDERAEIAGVARGLSIAERETGGRQVEESEHHGLVTRAFVIDWRDTPSAQEWRILT